jgi:hypothetical protein
MLTKKKFLTLILILKAGSSINSTVIQNHYTLVNAYSTRIVVHSTPLVRQAYLISLTYLNQRVCDKPQQIPLKTAAYVKNMNSVHVTHQKHENLKKFC